jgi:hypothetical protein
MGLEFECLARLPAGQRAINPAARVPMTAEKLSRISIRTPRGVSISFWPADRELDPWWGEVFQFLLALPRTPTATAEQPPHDVTMTKAEVAKLQGFLEDAPEAVLQHFKTLKLFRRALDRADERVTLHFQFEQ